MTQEKAVQAVALLNKIERLTYLIDRFREERLAKNTGLDPKCPGPKDHIIESIKREWSLVGEMSVAFFIEAWDATIRKLEEELRCAMKELEEL